MNTEWEKGDQGKAIPVLTGWGMTKDDVQTNIIRAEHWADYIYIMQTVTEQIASDFTRYSKKEIETVLEFWDVLLANCEEHAPNLHRHMTTSRRSCPMLYACDKFVSGKLKSAEWKGVHSLVVASNTDSSHAIH